MGMRLFLAALAAMLWLPAFAEEPPPEAPMLRIEAGTHIASFRGLAVSADGRLLATGSDDNTVRLWSLPDGKLVRTLRPPASGTGSDKIFSLAMAPDGSWVAAGGYDAHGSLDHKHYVYVFDASNGDLLRRIGPMPDTITALAVSPDGRRLAAGLGGKAGVRVIDMPAGEIVGKDERYRSDVYAAAFDPAGNLAAASTDGRISLYDAAFKRLRNGKTSGQFPIALAFSPDGQILAVTYYDTRKIDFLDPTTLKAEGALDLTELGSKGMTLAWSADGQRLFTGGPSDGNTGQGRVFIFERGGSAPKVAKVAAANIRSLVYTPQHGLVFASFDPGFGILGDDLKVSLFRGPVSMAMSDDVTDRVTAVSADAERVMFPLALGAGEAVVFDLAKLSLAAPSETPTDLFGPSASGIPRDLGSKLKLADNEGLWSLAGLGEGGFLLGSNFNLRRFDGRGRNVWTKPSPGPAGAINTSADREVAVVVYGDGTIRWHRVADGEEILALFVHVPDRRWIAWTPQGYYAASPGGEALIGWHVNRGWDAAADFFPAAQFRERFYRPDIVELVLKTRDVAAAVRIANENANRKPDEEDVGKELPPVIEILDLKDGVPVNSQSLTIRYKLRSPSGLKIISVEPLIDGRPPGTRGLTRVDADVTEAQACPGERGLARVSTCADGEITVAIPDRDFELSLIARTSAAASVPATVKLKWQGAVATAEGKARLFAVVVGVSSYANPDFALGFAAKDARDMAGALEAQAGSLYGAVETKLLVDADATVPNILDALAWLEDNVKGDDVGLLFLAGHGVTDERQRFFYLPHEADVEKLRSTAVSNAQIQETIGALAGKVLFFIDACHSAGAFRTGAPDEGAADITGLVNDLSAAERGIVMFASSTGRELSLESREWENGAFTEALLEALAGKADYTGDGNLSVAEMDLWLSERVKGLTKLQQHAVVRRPDTVPDFAIAAVR